MEKQEQEGKSNKVAITKFSASRTIRDVVSNIDKLEAKGLIIKADVGVIKALLTKASLKSLGL